MDVVRDQLPNERTNDGTDPPADETGILVPIGNYTLQKISPTTTKKDFSNSLRNLEKFFFLITI
jgi:hypothetical protein